MNSNGFASSDSIWGAVTIIGICLIIASFAFALFFHIAPFEWEQGERHADEVCEPPIREDFEALIRFCEEREEKNR